MARRSRRPVDFQIPAPNAGSGRCRCMMTATYALVKLLANWLEIWLADVGGDAQDLEGRCK